MINIIENTASDNTFINAKCRAYDIVVGNGSSILLTIPFYRIRGIVKGETRAGVF